MVAIRAPGCLGIRQDMQPASVHEAIATLHVELSRPMTGLFDFFYIDLVGPFLRPCQNGPRHVLICLEHLIDWTMEKATPDVTTEAAKEFMEKEVLHSFRPPKTMASENAGFFIAAGLVNFMENNDTEWKRMAAHTTMSNGKVERMVCTIKKVVGRLV